MATLTQASKQWRDRPADQRFTSLLELNDHLIGVKNNSRGRVISSRSLQVVPDEQDNIFVQGPDGGSAEVTHHAFGQLSSRVGAPAGYLRDLPAPIAADCLNYGLRFNRDIADIGVLLYKNGGPAQLRAVTGPAYGRVWNATISQALVDRFGDGITGNFRVPGEFKKRVAVTKDNTTLFASDRDMFVFLADEDHRITVPNRRDGKPGDMARGFFVWNSEVGASTFGVATFLFDYVCCNRIVWGADEYREIRIRHTASAPDRWIEEVAPAIQAYANSSTASIVKAIAAAKANRINDVEDFLKKRFTKSQVSSIQAAHMADEQRPIETLWDAATGITAYARSVTYQNERVNLERQAGLVLDMAK
jgi:hypothetical protein